MAGALQPSAARPGAAFEVERVEVEDGRMVVSGWWSGVRGMRFVRPALLVDGRQVLATLEHKPWAPGGETPWTAAFPWDREIDLVDVTLVVAPSITVPLGPASAEGKAVDAPGPEAAVPEAPLPEALAPEAPAEDDGRAPRLEARVRELEAQLDEATATVTERETRCRELEATLGGERLTTQGAVAERDHSGQARTVAERERDHAVGQRDEAVADRDAAVRTRARMAAQRDEAVGALEAAEHQRDQALVERDEARAQRDEVLLAHRALQQHLHAQFADEERGVGPARPLDRRPLPELDPDADPDEPIGVRTIPAARIIGGDLHRPEHPRSVSKYDVWAMRVLGTIAAVCFVLLLVMILRAFV